MLSTATDENKCFYLQHLLFVGRNDQQETPAGVRELAQLEGVSETSCQPQELQRPLSITSVLPPHLVNM